MGLKEVIEETQKQLEEIENKEEVKEEEKEASKEEIKEEPKKEETKEESSEEKEPENTEEEKPKIKTNADYARERRERISAKEALERKEAELAAANARIAELTKPVEEQRQDQEPDKAEDPVSWADWRARQVEKKAEEVEKIAKEAKEKIDREEKRRAYEQTIEASKSEMATYENEFKKDHPDYDDVKKYLINSMAFSLKTLNPRMTNEKLADAVTMQLLMQASQYYNEGYTNPVEPLYDMAKSMGYQPVKEEVSREESKKPDLSKVAKNRERNAGMAGSAGGAGKGELTKLYAATEMTSAEWAKLPVEERERLMRG